MNVYDINNSIAEPVIQQWSHTSSIVNGIFKVGNKALNNESDALVMSNSGNVTTLTQGLQVVTTVDGPNQRTRFTSTADPLSYVDVGAGAGSVPKGTIKYANDTTNTNITINPNLVTFNSSGLQNGRTGVGNIAPNTYFMTARTGIDFLTDDTAAVLTPLSLKQDGTATMISTLTVPALKQGNIIQTLDGTNTRNRFANVADAATAYVEINQIPAAPSLIVLNAGAQMKITPSTIAVSNFAASPTQVAKIGTIPSFPGTFMIESYSDTQIRTSISGLSTATFKANGNTELLSTLTVPYISTTNIVATNANITTISSITISTTNLACINGNFSNISTQQISSRVANTPIAVNTSLAITMNPPFLVGVAGSNFLSAPRLITSSNIDNPTTYIPASVGEGMIIQGVLKTTYGAPFFATNSMEFIQNSGLTNGGFQFYHGSNANLNTPEWLGGFQINPKEFRLASTLTAVLPVITASTITTNTINTNSINATNISTTSISTTNLVANSISTNSLLATSISTTNIALNTINSVAYSPFYTGMIIPYAGAVGLIPSLTGWLYCNGQIVDGANPTYTALFTLLGITYGGAGNMFAVPDFRSRTIFGAMGGSYSASPVSFQMFATNFFTFALSAPPPNTIPPGNLPYNQCLAVDFIEAGFELAPGMLLSCANPAIDPNTYIIQNIINYPGGSGSYGVPVSTFPVIILTAPMSFSIPANTEFIIQNGNTFLMGQQTRNNYTTQDPLQVAQHTHTAFADTTPNTASSAGPVTSPSPQTLTNTGNNEPNLYYRIGTGIGPGAYYESDIPAGTPNIPSHVAVNFIIKT
jgi:microcystin-dependent protein